MAAPSLPMTPIQAIMFTTPDTSTPAIVTVPGTAPVFYPPANPITPTVPIDDPAATPITVPGAATQPVTNPVTTYPSPPASAVLVARPVTNPVSLTAVTNEPAIPGQSWCVARTGVMDAAIQTVIDYACGIGADCSQIQEGASCYVPDALQNHASYDFNSNYKRNPVATSCDFGDTVVVINSNPSTGSCPYPSTASMATAETAATPLANAASSSSTLTTVSPLTSSGTHRTVANLVTGTPVGLKTETPQAMKSSTSRSVTVVPCFPIVILTILLSAMFMMAK